MDAVQITHHSVQLWRIDLKAQLPGAELTLFLPEYVRKKKSLFQFGASNIHLFLG